MRLLEFEAKARLAAHGVPVPAGRVWPALPSTPPPAVVKAQVPRGGRGKSGGIVFVDDEQEITLAATRLLAQRVGDDAVSCVYVEERLSIARELYLAVVVDRDARRYEMLASPDGGVDVESASPERIVRVPIDPLLGLRDYAVRRLHAFLGLDQASKTAFSSVVQSLVATAVAEDAQLIEINPLVLTTGGRLVAADARMIVDDNARFRHPDWRTLTFAEEGPEVDRRLAAAGATGIEIDPEGDLVGVVSGAGLMMATLDWLTAAGVSVRYMVDLGGTPLADRRGLVPIVGALSGLGASVVFINAYFQTALADDFAHAIVEAHAASPLRGHVVVRLKGRNADAARRVLEPCDFDVHEGLLEGLRAAATAAVRRKVS
ncbi:MAG: ATP-grasp domain-containing protein [Vicinamibacterales bacterium]